MKIRVRKPIMASGYLADLTDLANEAVHDFEGLAATRDELRLWLSRRFRVDPNSYGSQDFVDTLDSLYAEYPYAYDEWHKDDPDDQYVSYYDAIGVASSRRQVASVNHASDPATDKALYTFFRQRGGQFQNIDYLPGGVVNVNGWVYSLAYVMDFNKLNREVAQLGQDLGWVGARVYPGSEMTSDDRLYFSIRATLGNRVTSRRAVKSASSMAYDAEELAVSIDDALASLDGYIGVEPLDHGIFYIHLQPGAPVSPQLLQGILGKAGLDVSQVKPVSARYSRTGDSLWSIQVEPDVASLASSRKVNSTYYDEDRLIFLDFVRTHDGTTELYKVHGDTIEAGVHFPTKVWQNMSLYHDYLDFSKSRGRSVGLSVVSVRPSRYGMYAVFLIEPE